MTDRPLRTVSIAPGGGPPPPLAGALVAWWRRDGDDVVVVRGRTEGTGEVWVHLEGEPGDDRFGHADPQADVHFFGPGVDDPVCRDAARRHVPTAELVFGDPEPGGRVEDLSQLPITTWAGFDHVGVFRILAGRGDRVRPIPHLIREVVYLVETLQAGHFLFDDADLSAYPGWQGAFEAELAQLPWALTWEGTVGGDRHRGVSRPADPAALP